jgi:subtilisin family serine protease
MNYRRVLDWEPLCVCNIKNFRSQQGFGGFSLFQRFPDLNNIIERRVDKKYISFLTQPIAEPSGEIVWYVRKTSDTPKLLSNLSVNEKLKYIAIKEETVSHYHEVIHQLRSENRNSDADALSAALKFINDDFIFCIGTSVVLGIWGIQPREQFNDYSGTLIKSLISSPNKKHYNITFKHKNVEGNDLVDIITISEGDTISNEHLPAINDIDGFKFIKWDKEPVGEVVRSDLYFNAEYDKYEDSPTSTITRNSPDAIEGPELPFYIRFIDSIKRLFRLKGCLKWLLYFLLFLILLLLLLCIFKYIFENVPKSIPSDINGKPWIKNDSLVQDNGGIYHPGMPYEPVPTPPEYRSILPPNQGVLNPIDSTEIVTNPGEPVIVGNRLNILLENNGKSVLEFAKAFKLKYPDSRYKVVYYDDVVKRIQIQMPPSERVSLKQKLPSQFYPEYDLFVFDESVFEGVKVPTDPQFRNVINTNYLKSVNAFEGWDITMGSNQITVAVVDNGFNSEHKEIKDKIVMPYNVWSHSKDIFAQVDDHGTHVAGIAVGAADNGLGLCGIAPNCMLMPIQVANQQNLMTTTSILDGILFALYQGADVINVSLGKHVSGNMPVYIQRELQSRHFKEEERLWNKVMEISLNHNAILVMAAGNDNVLAGINPMNRPKNFVVVSAVDERNNIMSKAEFSNYGEFSTISAPGVDIYSSIGQNGFAAMTGTSMAAPIVSGAIALMKSFKNDITAAQCICAMQSTGIELGGNIGKLLQIDKALQKVRADSFSECTSFSIAPSTGDVQVMLSWNNYNDLDLVCIDPNNEPVWFKNKLSRSGGLLEIDMNVDYPDRSNPIENIYWPKGKAPFGRFSVYLIYYAQHVNINETQYVITVKYGSSTKTFSGSIRKQDISKPIFTFVLNDEESSQIDKSESSPSGNIDSVFLLERNRILQNILKNEKQL